MLLHATLRRALSFRYLAAAVGTTTHILLYTIMYTIIY